MRRVIEMSCNKPVVKSMSSRGLLNLAPVTGEDIERVSTGTKFALQQWLTATESTT